MVSTSTKLLSTLALSVFATWAAHSSSSSRLPSFLSETPVTENQTRHVLEHRPKTSLQRCQAKLTGPIEATLCDYETVEGIQSDLHGTLHELVRTPFFKHLKIDLTRECPFWEENGFCVLRDCAVTTVDEEDIPLKWRAATLGQLNRSPSDELRKSFPGCYYRDSDYCVLDDEESKDGEYVDLTLNPERYTGYAGPAAGRVWSAIYGENCFGLSEADFKTTTTDEEDDDLLTTSSSSGMSPAGLSPLAQQVHEVEKDETCLEKKVYYRIISGLHASISTHLCSKALNKTTGEWGPDLQCFIDRVASHPERLQYIYFNTVLLLRAIARAGPYLEAYDTSSGVSKELPLDKSAAALVKEVVSVANNVGQFDETSLFRGGEEAAVLREEFKAHFRNVTRIMDCVGCDKCRLWGKIQFSGIGTALKILFEFDDKALDPAVNPGLLQRSEVVTLFNTLHQLSETLVAVDEFRTMWAEREASSSVESTSELPNDTSRTDHSSSSPSSHRVKSEL